MATKTYQRRESVLFQFLMHECIQLYHSIETHLKAPFFSQRSLINDRSSLLSLLSKLEGYLGGLKERIKEGTEKLTTHLHSLQELASKNFADQKAFQSGIILFLKELISKLPAFKCDENVLWYVVRYRKHLENILSFSLRPHIYSLFDKGIDDLKTLLLANYAARGFHHLLPKIKDEIENLHAAT